MNYMPCPEYITVAVHVTPFTVLLPFMFTANISGGKLIHEAAPSF